MKNIGQNPRPCVTSPSCVLCRRKAATHRDTQVPSSLYIMFSSQGCPWVHTRKARDKKRRYHSLTNTTDSPRESPTAPTLSDFFAGIPTGTHGSGIPTTHGRPLYPRGFHGYRRESPKASTVFRGVPRLNQIVPTFVRCIPRSCARIHSATHASHGDLHGHTRFLAAHAVSCSIPAVTPTVLRCIPRSCWGNRRISRNSEQFRWEKR